MTTTLANAVSHVIKSVSMTCTTGGRNAEYHFQLVQVDTDQYIVNYQYGTIGSALRHGSKPGIPVSLAGAQEVFDGMYAERKKKKYVESTEPTVTEIATSDDAETFQNPQLLIDITREEAEAMIHDDRYCMQEKHDGRRKVVAIVDGSARISNKLAEASAMEAIIISQIRDLENIPAGGSVQAVTLDGEHIGDKFHIFDILQLDDNDLRGLPYTDREALYQALLGFNKYGRTTDILAPEAMKHLIPVETYYSTEAKRAAFDRIEKSKREGVVFKLKDAPYTEGRLKSTGAAFKYRFKERSTCICLGDSGNGKRSIRLGMLDSAGDMVFVGKLTVPANLSVPVPNDLVEVEYAHMFEGGALYHSVMIGTRDDVRREECTLSQVKRIKAKSSEADEE